MFHWMLGSEEKAMFHWMLGSEEKAPLGYSSEKRCVVLHKPPFNVLRELEEENVHIELN